jgi:hypothetical protein
VFENQLQAAQQVEAMLKVGKTATGSHPLKTLTLGENYKENECFSRKP